MPRPVDLPPPPPSAHLLLLFLFLFLFLPFSSFTSPLAPSPSWPYASCRSESMVRVPCQRCVSARAKCDGNLPCGRCKVLKTPCPSRPRAFKFQDERPALLRRYGSTLFPSSPSPSLSSSSQPEPEPPERDDSRESLSIDEQVSPSLAASAVSYQQTQIYSDFVMCCFPCIFKCTESRVPVTCIEFVDFISRRTSPSNTPFDWALRATTTTFTGFLYNDSRLIDAGASSYARALRSLAIALSDTSTAKSDEVLATAMGLAFYEKYTSPSPEPWLRHAAGIRTLMRMRGPDSHLHGFGHAMYVAYRHFFITAALIAGEECFLQEPEWQALNEKIVDQDAKQPHSSVYTDIVERGFREMVKTPGYVKQVRETLALPSKKQTAARSRLLQNIQASRAALRGVHTELGVSISMIQADHRDGGFIGPVPYFFFDGFSTHAMRGIRSGIVLLNHLVSLLDPKQRPAIDQENRTLADRASNSPQYASASLPTPPLSSDAPPGRPRLMIEAADTLGKKESITTDWMDRIVTTMGMDGVRVTLADSE